MQIQVESMTAKQKIEAMEALWASLSMPPDGFDSPQWHRDLLAERRERLTRGDASVSDWEEAKQRLRTLGQ